MISMDKKEFKRMELAFSILICIIFGFYAFKFFMEAKYSMAIISCGFEVFSLRLLWYDIKNNLVK